MTKEQQQVKEFMIKVGQSCPSYPNTLSGTTADENIFELRYRLIKEELNEYEMAGDEEEIADALGDMLYVVLGAAVAHGIDLEPVFQEIHRSNMTKFIDGKMREDGKWVKGPSYTPANLKPIIDAQCK